MHGAQVQSLFRELRSHMPWGMTKKKTRRRWKPKTWKEGWRPFCSAWASSCLLGEGHQAPSLVFHCGT